MFLQWLQTKDSKGWLWLHGEKEAAHYDVLEDEVAISMNTNTQEAEQEPIEDLNDIQTESEMQIDSEPTPKVKRRPIKWNVLSLKKTTTQYNQVCGVCQAPHTRRCSSVLCSCHPVP